MDIFDIFMDIFDIFVDIYKNALFSIHKFLNRVFSVSYILFRNKTCRFLKNPRFRILRTSAQDVEIIFVSQHF